jgi:hypothetical protein
MGDDEERLLLNNGIPIRRWRTWPGAIVYLVCWSWNGDDEVIVESAWATEAEALSCASNMKAPRQVEVRMIRVSGDRA